ncbi:MAG: hypothetical protein R6T91_00030 [Bacteroidales bacterium]
MKTRLLFISTVILGITLFSACSTDTTPMDQLKDAAVEIDKIEERSADISSAEEAFIVLRDFNQVMKDVRNAVMAMDAEYKDMSKEEFAEYKESAEFQTKMDEFKTVNNDIDDSMKTISENVDPYKEDKQVEDMLKKLEDILITR